MSIHSLITLFPRIKNYPLRRLNDLKQEWTFVLHLMVFFGVPALVMMYLAVFHGFNLFVSTVLLAFFLLLFSVNLCSCVSETLHVRVVPILESRTPGVRAYDVVPVADEFLRNHKKGRDIGKYYKILVEWATKQGIPSLADFGAVSVFDPDKTYHDAEEGLQAVSALIASLARCPDLVGDSQRVIADLSDLALVLDEAVKAQMQFCFAIM